MESPTQTKDGASPPKNAGLFDESAVISQTPSRGTCNYSGSARVNDPSCVTPQCVGTVCTLQLVWRLISVLRARAPRSSTSGPGVGCRQLTVAMQNIHARACRVYARHGCQLRGTRYTAYPELPKEIQLLVQEATNLGEETVDHEPERISQRAIAASQTGRSSCGTQRAVSFFQAVTVRDWIIYTAVFQSRDQCGDVEDLVLDGDEPPYAHA